MLKNTETNFELNLLPIISLLAVCISFLLVTAVWLPLGIFDIKQAIGESQPDNTTPPSRFEISILKNNQFIFTVEKEGKKIKQLKITDSSRKQDEVSKNLKFLREKYPDIKMAFVSPEKNIKYGHVIGVIELLNKYELKEIGVIPSL